MLRHYVQTRLVPYEPLLHEIRVEKNRSRSGGYPGDKSGWCSEGPEGGLSDLVDQEEGEEAEGDQSRPGGPAAPTCCLLMSAFLFSSK